MKTNECPYCGVSDSYNFGQCISCGEQEVPLVETETECRYCQRIIVNEQGVWVDPNATGDDEVWRECCDSHHVWDNTHEPYTEGD